MMVRAVHGLGLHAPALFIRAEARLGDLSDSENGVVGESQPC
jgi:hypothetical protein